MADTDASDVERIATEIESYPIPTINRHVMSTIMRDDTLALVAMLHDDQANYEACELACRVFAVPRIIVRLKEISRAREFLALGAVVINPGSAMVNLLDQSVRSPESAPLILRQDSDFEMVQVVVTEPDVTEVPLSDLRLPKDVLVLSIQRDTHSMVAHGYTTLQMGDEVNLMGTAESLEEVARQLR
jgi:Trk K+ transport system NAD-binding subunit